jgi:predicted phage terminase large subunit-like protein
MVRKRAGNLCRRKTELEEIVLGAITSVSSLPSPQPGRQEEFLASEADITIYGGGAGSGKSAAVLLDFARQELIQNSKYAAVVFRRTSPQITNPGGLWDSSMEFYKNMGTIASVGNLTHTFLSGAKIKFAHLQHEKNKYDWQGAEVGRLAFDELTHFTESQFFYLLSRNRTTSGIPTKIRATTNPDANSWVKDLISWWIDDDGEMIGERSGILRWFIRHEEQTVWGDSRDDLLAEYDDCEPMSLTFIPATVYDNPKLLEKDPKYISRLKALHPVDRARLLGGNWKIDFTGGTVFSRDWFHRDTFLESEAITVVRFWDLAGTAKEQATKNSCYTAGVKMGRKGNKYTVLDMYAEQIGAANLEQTILNLAKQDGKKIKVRWELEGGSESMAFSAALKTKLNLMGIDGDAVKPRGDKLTRAIPLATEASNGGVAIAYGGWNDQYLTCLQKFDGSRVPLITDVTDASSGAYSVLKASYLQSATKTNADNNSPAQKLRAKSFSSKTANPFK